MSLICVSQLCMAQGARDVERNVADLEQLVREVKKFVPEGWNLQFDVAESYLGDMRPVLTISSAEELPVQRFGMGMASSDPPFEREKVKLWLAFMAYKSPAEHAAARELIERLTRERREFVEQRLQQLEIASKGEDPPSPGQFRPRSAAEGRLVREYAFLWLATEPESLPSHHYGTLSMWYWGEDTIKIHDSQRDKEYQQIAAGLEQIVTAYEKETPTPEGHSTGKR
jgi:hypothetical protein